MSSTSIGKRLLSRLLIFYAKVFKKHHVYRDDALRGLTAPFVVLGNHSSFYDFVYINHALFPHFIHFVVARKYFEMPFLGGLLRYAGAIPKSLSQADAGTVRKIFSLAKEGRNIGIFPEGQIPFHGITFPLEGGTAKLIKKLGLPVVTVMTGGGYFIDPPWTQRKRKGRAHSEAKLLLTPAQIEASSVEQLDELITRALTMSQYEWQQDTGNRYRGTRLAEGLENILYRCPVCHQEFTLFTENNHIRCSSCQAVAVYNPQGRFSLEGREFTLGEWYDMQRQTAREYILSQPDFSLSSPVELAMFTPKGIDVVGKGSLQLTREAYTYTGTIHGQQVTMVFNTTLVHSIPYDAGSNFQIYHQNLLYEFRPAEPKHCSKFAVMGEAAHLSTKSGI